MRHRPVAILVVLVVMVIAFEARADYPRVKLPPLPCQKGVEAAFERAKVTGDLSEVKRELAKLYLDPSSEIQAAGLGWIGRHAKELTGEQQTELETLYLEVNPKGGLAAGVRNSLARERFERWPREEREKAYWEAVKNGKVVVEEYYEVPRPLALGFAAMEGMEQFKPVIESHRAEINLLFKHPGPPETDLILWELELRAGAPSREAAVGVAVGRLAAYEDSQFSSLMEEDPAFRHVVKSLVNKTCDDEPTSSCVDLARVAVRQEALRRERLKAQGKEPQPCYPESAECDWVDRLLDDTSRGRERLRAVNQPQ